METWRFVAAIILAMAVVLLTNVLFPPAPPPEGALAPDSAAAGDTAIQPRAPAPTPTPAPAQTVEAAPTTAAADTVPADTIRVTSDLTDIGISTRGAGIVSAQLRQFDSYTRDGAVELVDAGEPPLVGYRLRQDGRELDLGGVPYQVTSDAATADGGRELVLTYRSVEGLGMVIRYTFHPDRYTIDVHGELIGLGGRSTSLLLDLGPTLAVNEADSAEDYRALGYVVNSRQDGIYSVNLRDVEEDRVEEGPLRWVAIKNKYFLLAALPGTREAEGDFGGLIAHPVEGEHRAELTATLPLARAGSAGSFSVELYLGPQDAGRLAAVGRNLQDVNPYGWKFLRPIIRPLAHLVIWLLTALHNVLSLAYGWVLILFGILIQVILWPLNVRAMRSQMKTMELQPRIKEIQDKFKQEPEKLQKEMMRLYKEEGFNPLGGCLPMLIPWPVLITLFFVFQNTIEFRGVEFLWLPDLSRPDPLFILPILLGASIFAMQWLSMRTAPQQNQQMKMMLYFMPIMMVVIFFRLASGLNLYYAASNLASVPRQMMLVKERKAVRARMDGKA